MSYKTGGLVGSNLWVGQPFAQAAAGFVANDMRGVPVWVPQTITVSKMRINVSASSGNISVAIYDNAGSRIATSGSVPCPAVGIQDVAFTAAVTLSSGRHLFALSADNGTATFFTINRILLPGSANFATSHPAPATVSIPPSSFAGALPALVALP